MADEMVGYNDKLDADRQVTMEEQLASLLHSFQEGQIELDDANGCDDYTLTEEDCQTVAKQLLYTVLREFRPDLFDDAESRREPIGHHYTCLTARMAVDGTLHPNMVQVKDDDEALEKARADVKDGTDPMESCLGCLTVYSDGSVSHDEYSMDTLNEEDDDA
jgi:hypothetical protein